MKSLKISRTTFPRNTRFLAIVALLLVSVASGLAAQNSEGNPEQQANVTTVAPVVVDGSLVMQVRGVSALPARERAKHIRKKIIEVAEDESISPADLTIVHETDRSAIYAGDSLLVNVFDVDAEIENLDRKLLTEVLENKIANVVDSYRRDRSLKVVLEHTAYALGLTVVFIFLLWGGLWIFRRLNAWSVRHMQKSVQDLASKSRHLVRADQLWTLVRGLFGALRVFALLVLGYFYLNTVLGLFPWTRPAALVLFDLVLNPLRSLWNGFVDSLPDLAFLVVLAFVLHYILKLLRMFFTQVARGRIKLQNFDPDWAFPTHKIARFLIIAFALVIAYPYIPGSDSMAFKGVSVFVGLIFSFGSTSFVANIMAGLSMTYRGAFKVGDRVKIDDVSGKVAEVRLMTTRIVTPKRESVVIPNSNIVNANVTNYSVEARASGVLLHTSVGIGYDSPWRQVEAMLILAVQRTAGLKQEPAPFVLQTEMGDFAVNYEINAYCTEVDSVPAIKSELHRNIQDVFNEHGVQIMSPAYVMDPEKPKLVRPEHQWAAPASEPEE